MAKDEVKEEEKEKKIATIGEVTAALNKKFGKGTIGTPKQLSMEHYVRVKCGIPSLDMAIGGGFPRGRIIELYGEESSGKTTAAMKLAGVIQKQGEKAAIIDIEHAQDMKWNRALGVNTDELLLSQPDTGEEALDILDALVRSNTCGVVIFDSIAAAEPKAEMESSMDSAQMGVAARMMNKGIRKVQSALNTRVDERIPNQTIVIFINQIRMKIGVMFGNPETTSGGMGTKFGASIRIRTARGAAVMEGVKDAARVVGQTTRFKVVKNKTFVFGQEGEYHCWVKDAWLKAGEFNIWWDVLSTAKNLGVVTTSGSNYYFGELRLGCGADNVVANLRETPDLFAALWQETEDVYLGRKVFGGTGVKYTEVVEGAAGEPKEKK